LTAAILRKSLLDHPPERLHLDVCVQSLYGTYLIDFREGSELLISGTQPYIPLATGFAHHQMRIAGHLKLYALGGILLLAIPACCLLALRSFLKSGRQRAAISILHQIQQSQTQFKIQQGRYGTLIELSKAGLLEGGLAHNANSHFKYWVSDLTSSTVCVHADRMSPQAANCDFNLCEDGSLYSRCSKEPGSVPRGQRIGAH
jgi:hypothetical protein